LELSPAVQSAIIIDLAHPMAALMLVLLDYHHGALLLAAGPAAHHDDIGTLLDHLEMLRESLAYSQDYILLRLRRVGWLLGMNLLHIHHLMLCRLDVDELVIRAHLLLLMHRIKGGSNLIPASGLEDLVSWWRILLLSRRGPIIIISIIHSEG
jgi:hypothetical protein